MHEHLNRSSETHDVHRRKKAMKKLVGIAIVVGLIGVLSVGAYAYYGHQGGMMYGSRGGMMYGGPRGGRMYGPGWMQGRGPGGRWNAAPETCPCGAFGNWNTARPGWNAPGQSETAPQVITEDKAKEVAEAYVKQYLPGYTIDKIEKDNWRPLYFVTIKGANNAEQVITIHGFGGQVMHVFPKTVEKPAE